MEKQRNSEMVVDGSTGRGLCISSQSIANYWHRSKEAQFEEGIWMSRKRELCRCLQGENRKGLAHSLHCIFLSL